MTTWMRQGDTSPRLTATLKDASGERVNLSDADVSLRLVDAFTRLPFLEAEANIDQDDEDEDTFGDVSYDWQPGDTDTPGVYRGEFAVTYMDENVESFPNSATIELVVTRNAAEEAS